MGGASFTKSFVCGVLLMFAAAGLGLASAAAAEAVPERPRLEADSVELTPTRSGYEFRCIIANPMPHPVQQRLDIRLAGLDRSIRAEAAHGLSVKPGVSTYAVPITGTISGGDVPYHLVQFALSDPSGSVEYDAKLMVDAMAQLETRLLTYSTFQAGAPAAVRVATRNLATQAPAPNAEVRIALVRDGREWPLFSGQTDTTGTVDAQFEVPIDTVGEADLRVQVRHSRLGEDQIDRKVSVKRDTKMLLTTDKPLYQPGQLIQMRALSLRAATLEAVGSESLTFEVMDSKGNKVFKKTYETDAFGIAAATFQLASEVNLGEYIVRAILGDTVSEKQVNVDRYVLPKFKVDVTTDRAFYLPGGTLKADVAADYFFGKPVAGGTVTITASHFAVNWEEFAKIEGRLDESGRWSFDLPLPRYLAGTPIEQGQASIRLVAEVIDTADHREEKVVMKPVAAAPFRIVAVPEGGQLAPGLENRVFILITEPSGAPVEGAMVRLAESQVIAGPRELTTDRLGITETRITVPDAVDGENIPIAVTVQDRQGRTASDTIHLDTRRAGERLILRTDKALYNVGETVTAEVLAVKPRGTVYFDVIRQGQTVLTRATDLENGRARIQFELDATLAGSVAVQAYVFTPGTNIVRDSRLLFVNPANELNLAIALDRQTYKPGEDAQLTFNVTDRNGRPVAAALGLSIVDESVFALQEMHPGLEKVYFMLEREIMKPRYEIHEHRLDDLISQPPPVPVPRPGPLPQGGARPGILWDAEQQRAAQVMLASAAGVPAPSIHVNTAIEKREASDKAIVERFEQDMARIHRTVVRYLERNRGRAPEDILGELLRRRELRPSDLMDPWGNRYEFDFSQVEQWGGYFTMLSCGPDGIKGTDDDISPDTPWGRSRFPRYTTGRAQGGFGGGVFGGALGMVRGGRVQRDAPDEVMALAMPAPMAEAAAPPVVAQDDMAFDGGPGASPEPARIREHFPETLLFEPALITDNQGRAVLDVPLADSITTWRMTTMASSVGGLLGSKDAPLRVFQDFFADIDLPVALTQNDRVSIPVAVYNYLDRPQDVRIRFEEAPWFALQGDPEQTLRLEPEAVRAVYFPIEVKELGKHRLTVFAYGSDMSDALRREIEVLPDGERVETAHSGRLSGTVEHTINITEPAIPGASKILVRIYPGTFSQIVDGLDSMLRMPFGCFEQTSSVSYPNVLILQYLRATEQINPEIQMTAEGFINAGYQRLLTYEVDGGGFSWFGDAPANKVLTAWGVRQFHDMGQVYEVDPAIVERTREWLIREQEADGAWAPDASYLHGESWSGIQGGRVLVTAYVLDGILTTGYTGQPVDRAIAYLRQNWQNAREAYPLALVANALVSWDAKDAWTRQVLAALYDLRREEGDIAYWPGGTSTVTFSQGGAADIETTALAAIAFLRAGMYNEAATKALNFLVEQKGPQGHWGSTQGTILALKALTVALGSRTEQIDGTIAVALDGETAAELRITPEDSDVMRLVDLGDKTRTGRHTVRLALDGDGSMMYQVVGRHYVPWTLRGPIAEPLSIDVSYDKTELEVNDIVTASVTVRNQQGVPAPMVIVDLGIPPGFQVVAADLEALVEKRVIQKYELTGRQIIAYFEEIRPNATVEFSYGLRAKYPLRAQSTESRVYAYYNPEISGTAAPRELVVR